MYESIGSHWIGLYVSTENGAYLDSFGVEHTTKEITKFTGNENIVNNICRIQTCNSVMYRYCHTGLIIFMLKGKGLLGYTNSFSPDESKKKVKVILKYFQQNLNKLK